MNKNSFFALMLFATSTICSCKSIDTEIVSIDLKSNSVPIDRIDNHIKIDSIIPVFSKNNQITDIDKIAFTGHEIFLLDKKMQSIFRINTETKTLDSFLHKQGRARNEYVSISDFAVSDKGEIFVLDGDTKKVNKYDSRGNYLSTFRTCSGTSIAVSEEGNFAIYCGLLNADTAVIIYSRNGEKLYSSNYTKEVLDHPIGNGGFITAKKNSFVYSTPFDYCLHEAANGRNEDLVHFDFKSFNINRNEVENMSAISFHEWFQKTDQVMFINNISAYKDNIIASTDRNDVIFYDSMDGKGICLSCASPPYNMLFAQNVVLNSKGRICSVISKENFEQGILPWFTNNEFDVSMDKTKEDKENIKTQNSVSFYILLGHLK